MGGAGKRGERLVAVVVSIGSVAVIGALLWRSPAADPVEAVAASVPWSDRTDFEEWQPPVPEPREPTTACRSRDLAFAGTSTEGATGHLGLWVKVRNVGSSRCTMSGFPGLGGTDSRGDYTDLDSEQDTWFRSDEHERPATIDPGEEAVTVVETSMACGDQTPAYAVQDLRVLLPDGAQLPTDAGLESACRIRVDSWYRDNVAPLRLRFRGLEAAIDAPALVRPATTLIYTVTLRNMTDAAVDLMPCPGFRQSLQPLDLDVPEAAKVGITGGSRRLSCESVTPLQPGAEVAFEMQVDASPLLSHARAARLEWMLYDATRSAHVSARVTVAK